MSTRLVLMVGGSRDAEVHTQPNDAPLPQVIWGMDTVDRVTLPVEPGKQASVPCRRRTRYFLTRLPAREGALPQLAYVHESISRGSVTEHVFMAVTRLYARRVLR